MHTIFWISKDSSCEPYIRVYLVNGFRWDCYHWYFWTATYHQSERGIWSSNKVNYIRLMPNYNDLCSGLDYMVKTKSYLALQGWYDTDSAKVLQLLSTTNTWRSTHRAHLLWLQTIQDESYLHAVWQQVYHVRETHVHRVCSCIILTSLRDVSQDFGIPNSQHLCCRKIHEDWGHKGSGLVLEYDQNILTDSIFVKLQNGLLYYSQPFHWRTSVEHLGLDYKLESTNVNQGIMRESHNFWVQYTQSKENDLDNTFHRQISFFCVLDFSWTPPTQILQFQERLPAGKGISNFSMRCKKTQQWVLRPQVQEYAVFIPMKYKDLNGCADCVDGFI